MKVLTASENRLVQHYALRMLELQQRIEALMKLPLDDMHPETGLPVWLIATLAIESMGWLNHDLQEVLE